METVYYTPKEVADQLKLRVQTIYDYIRKGRLPAVRLGNRCRIAQSDLEAFLADRQKAPSIGAANAENGRVLRDGWTANSDRDRSGGTESNRTVPPADSVSEQIDRNQAARRLLAEWMSDESGYDEQVWPVVERLIQENPVSFRESARD